MPLSNYQRARLLRIMFQGETYVNDDIMYLCLATREIDPDEVFTVVDEADYEGYARVSIASDDGNWVLLAGEDGIENVQAIQFPRVVSGINVIVSFVLVDSEIIGTGNVLAIGTLSAYANLNPSDDPTFDAGDVSLKFGG